MNGRKLMELVNSGVNPLVEFTKCIEETEMRWGQGMKGYAIGVIDNEDGTISIRIEEREFADYNKSIEKPIWRKEVCGEYIYKWSEIFNSYRECDYVICDEYDNELCNIKIVDKDSLKLFNIYKAEAVDVNYIKWLENKVLEYMSKED